MQLPNSKELRLYNLELKPFTFCKSRSGNKYILLKNDGEHAIYYMEDSRKNMVQQTCITSTKQNAYVTINDKPIQKVDNLLQVTYSNKEALEFQEEAVNYLLNYYDDKPNNKKKLEIADELRNFKKEILSNDLLEQINSKIKSVPLKSFKLKYDSPLVEEIISKRIERGMIASKIKEVYDYKCKICEALGKYPYSFKKTNGKFYIETHHIIHVAKLEQGSLGVSNLITVCANHHRQFHYGNVEVIENTNERLVVRIDEQEITIRKKQFNDGYFI